MNFKGNFQENRRYTSFGSKTLMIVVHRRQVREEAALGSRKIEACAIDVKVT